MPSEGVWSGAVTSLASLADVRFEVRALLTSLGHRTEHLDDISLVVSELVVNAFVHGGAQRVELDVHTPADSITIRLRHRDHDRPESLVDPLIADPSSPSGRGRAIVERLASSITIGSDADGSWEQIVTVACTPTSSR
jgi:anti-sigma regulatory factor (Ser/Thr protein kinase)